MKLTPECVPCLLGRVAYEVSLCDPGKVMDALRECGKVVAERTSEEISSVEFATEIHKRAYSILNKADPYLGLKKRSNAAALKILPTAERFIERYENRLKASMIVSIVGNLMDFGIQGSLSSPEKLREDFMEKVADPLSCDDSAEIENILKKAKEVFFLADNCGEIVFDKLLLREIKSFGTRIVLLVKGEPVLTDATINDIIDLELDDIVDEIIEINGFAIGIDLWSGINDELVRRMRGANLIISKGMANFEALSEFEWDNLAYLMRVKCRPVSNSLSVDLDSSVIKLIDNMNG